MLFKEEKKKRHGRKVGEDRRNKNQKEGKEWIAYE